MKYLTHNANLTPRLVKDLFLHSLSISLRTEAYLLVEIIRSLCFWALSSSAFCCTVIWGKGKDKHRLSPLTFNTCNLYLSIKIQCISKLHDKFWHVLQFIFFYEATFYFSPFFLYCGMTNIGREKIIWDLKSMVNCDPVKPIIRKPYDKFITRENNSSFIHQSQNLMAARTFLTTSTNVTSPTSHWLCYVMYNQVNTPVTPALPGAVPLDGPCWQHTPYIVPARVSPPHRTHTAACSADYCFLPQGNAAKRKQQGI